MKAPDTVSGKSTKGDNPVKTVVLRRLRFKSMRRFFSMLGAMYLLLSEATYSTAKGMFVPGQRIGGDALVAQMVRVGVRAIPIVILVEMAIGMILPLQMFPKLDEFGQAEQIATINAISGFRELGPLMTAVVLCGFAGASIAA